MIFEPLLAEGELQSGAIAYDFRAFLFKGGASLSPLASRDDLARRRAGKLQSGRVDLVKALHEAFLERKLSGAAGHSLGSYIAAIRKFWKFCDSGDFRFVGLETVPIRRAVSEYATAQVHLFRSGKIQERTAGAAAWGAVGLLADALRVEARELVGRTTMPRVNTGTQALAHEKLDLAAIDTFIDGLNRIVHSLSGERLYGGFPIQIEVGEGDVVSYFGMGPRPTGGEYSYRNWNKKRVDQHKNFDRSYERRLPLLQIRVQAECLRFIENTAINLAQVLELTVGDLKYRSISGEYEVTGFKDRANRNVTFRISKTYRPAFDRYLEFRRTAMSDSQANTLFPFHGKGGVQSKYIATRGFRSLRRLFTAAGKTFIAPSLLRFAKGQRVIRLLATGGNLATVAGVLQNTVQVVLKSYLIGSQTMAVVEFTRFLKTISTHNARNNLRLGGDCRTPGRPVEIPGLAKTVPAPDCINPAGCLFCKHYRGVKSRDYLHKILSYRTFLRLRAGLPASSSALVTNVLAPTIERINDFVEAVAGESEHLKGEAAIARIWVEDGRFHRAWLGWIELLQLSEGGARVHT